MSSLTQYEEENFLPSELPLIVNLHRAVKNYILLDLETTGLDPESDRIIQITAVKIKDGKPEEARNYYIDPTPVKIPSEVKDMLGLNRHPDIERQIFSGQTVNHIKSKLFDFLGDYPIVAHNARFDYGFLCSALGRLKNSIVDTLEIALLVHPEFPNHRLNTLITKAGIKIEEAKKLWFEAKVPEEKQNMTTWALHNGVTDVSLLAVLYGYLIKRFYDRNNPFYSILTALLPEAFGNVWNGESPEISCRVVNGFSSYVNHDGLINYLSRLDGNSSVTERYILSYLISWKMTSNKDDLDKISYWCKSTFKLTSNIIASV